MQKEMGRRFVWIGIQVIDPLRVELARPPDETVDFVSLFEEELGEIRAVLAGNAGDEGNLRVGQGSTRFIGWDSDDVLGDALAVSNAAASVGGASEMAAVRAFSNRPAIGPMSKAFSA